MPDREPDITITLPMPPSANKRLIPALGKDGIPTLLRSKATREWMRSAALDVMAQRRGRVIVHRTEAVVSLAPSNFDADAPIKSVFDALERGGAVGNDRLIRPYTVTDNLILPEGWIRVQLWDTGERYERKRNDPAAKQNREVENALVRTFGKRPRLGGTGRTR